MATYVCCVILRLNIQTTSVGIKSYVKKVKSRFYLWCMQQAIQLWIQIAEAQAGSYQNSFCLQHLLKEFQDVRPPKNHKEVCSEEAQPPTMVDMVNSDEIVPELENHVDVPKYESIVDEVPNDFTDIVENIRHPVEDVPVCADEVADLIT